MELRFYHILLLIVLAMTTSDAQVVLDSTQLPILTIDTRDAIRDEPKVNGTLSVFSDHSSGYNKLTHAPTLKHKIGVEYRGQTSQKKFPKKGLGIEFRNEKGEDKAVEILGLPADSDWVIHSPYSDKTLIRNALVYSLASELFEYAPKHLFCELILNGEYYGVVLLTEKIKIGPHRVDIPRPTSPEDENGGYILKFDKGTAEEVAYVSSFLPSPESKVQTRVLFHDPPHDEVSSEQEQDLRHFLFHFERELNESGHKHKFDRYIDTESFVRYMLLSELTRNVDAYRISTYFYKEPGKHGKLKAGPVWDYNLAFGNADFCDGNETEGWSWDFNSVCHEHSNLVHFWWKRFIQDEAFVETLNRRYEELRKTLFSDAELHQRIDNLIYGLEDARKRNFKKWDIIGKEVWPNYIVGQSYEEEIQNLKDWISQRTAWVDENLPVLSSENSGPSFLSYRVYPNPVYDQLNLELRSTHATSIEVKIMDLHSREEYLTYTSSPTSTYHQQTIDVSHLTGVHIVQMIIDGKIVVNNKVVMTGK